MSSIKRRLAIVLGSFVLILGLISTALPAPILAYSDYPLSATDTEVVNALNYLRGSQTEQGDIGGFATSAWVTMAIAAAEEDPHDWKVGSNPSIVDYLEAHAGEANLSKATDVERMILAVVAADENPTNFDGVDFVAALGELYDGTQIGDASLLNDDFWGVMALISAGESPSAEIVANSVSFIENNQNSDGGWSWGVGGNSDVDDTACAVMALIAAGEPQGSTAIQNALAYIKSTQVENGGFESWGATNSATDSWAIDAIMAAGQDPTSESWESGDNNNPVDDLLTFRNPDGSFNWQSDTPSNKALMTAYAIPALLGQPYPVKILEPEEGVSVHVRIEGQNATIWSGDVTVTNSTIIDDQGGSHYLPDPTTLGALDEASRAGGFSYTVHYFEGLGLAIYSIAGEGDWGAGPWWLYRVDYRSAEVGADSFILNETSPPDPPHHEVLFYISTTFTELPLKISVDKAEVDVDEEFTATVEVYSDDTHDWSPCEGATVHADQDYLTGADGAVTISVDHDVTLHIFAEKDGCIRSDKVTVIVGEGTIQPPSSGEVNLIADIIPAISIEVSPDSIDFGDGLGSGDTSSGHEVNITNVGAWEIMVTAEVADEADNLYVNGIRLDGGLWSLVQAIISRDGSTATQVSLHVPEDYAGVGEKTGTLTFWAEAAS